VIVNLLLRAIRVSAERGNAMDDRAGGSSPVPLTVRSLRKEYDSAAGPLRVLQDVSFDLVPGGTLAVIGPSGAGKSTLLNIIGSLDKPTSGSVRLGETEVTALEGAALAHFRGRGVGFVFQEHHLLPQCSALENVLLPTLAAKERGGFFPRGRRGVLDRGKDLLGRVGLGDRLDSFPVQLSGGERQRVAIARALVNGPPLLLCDEPTGNLDHESAAEVGALFLELARERGVMLVVVTHNLEFARLFGRCLELRDGALRAWPGADSDTAAPAGKSTRGGGSATGRDEGREVELR
jgi:lipoprotein-releasing system ATP-binding protein